MSERRASVHISDTARRQRFSWHVFGLFTDDHRSAAPSTLILQVVGCSLSLKDRATGEVGKPGSPGDVEPDFIKRRWLAR
ncbi:hypothetical protein [Deinococcus alpinitundrae]|uniref:hypothetical protein n=1 Tax=Deinococcus alpinitundrae TaxID=468913 RepID=UPI00137A8D49|nr:hypothetical protein [Deinococcus alpinitundrae]